MNEFERLSSEEIQRRVRNDGYWRRTTTHYPAEENTGLEMLLATALSSALSISTAAGSILASIATTAVIEGAQLT